MGSMEVSEGQGQQYNPSSLWWLDTVSPEENWQNMGSGKGNAQGVAKRQQKDESGRSKGRGIAKLQTVTLTICETNSTWNSRRSDSILDP